MEPQAPSSTPNLRLLCSYGGRIVPIPPAKSLQYIGGETRIIVVPRGISFTAFFQLLSMRLLSGRSFSLKYRIPGCDLDSLITVSDNDDLQNMIAEYDSASFRRIRLFLFPLNYPESASTRCSVSVNQLLGLESPIQRISFSSSSSVFPFPIFPQSNGPGEKRVNHGKIDATLEENRIKDEGPITSGSFFSVDNTTVADTAGGVLEKETERVEIQDQSRPIFVQEPSQPQNQLLQVVYYVPVWPMQPHMVTHARNGYALSPATEVTECSSELDSVAGNKENAT